MPYDSPNAVTYTLSNQGSVKIAYARQNKPTGEGYNVTVIVFGRTEYVNKVSAMLKCKAQRAAQGKKKEVTSSRSTSGEDAAEHQSHDRPQQKTRS